jgi:tetratricopeptide (TPR) repeat protein
MNRVIKLLVLLVVIVILGCGAAHYTMRLEQSQGFLNNGQYEKARRELLKIIEEYPKKPEPYYLLGLVCFATEQYEECLVNFEKAAFRGLTKNFDFYADKGIALYKTGDMENAEKNLRQAVSIKSTGTVQKFLGVIRYMMGDYEGSVEAFRKASSMENDVNSLFCFGMALYNLGMNAEALDILMKAYSRSPGDEVLLFQTANILMLNDRNSEAIDMYAKIPPDSRYYDISVYNSAEASMQIEDYKNAERLLEPYVKKMPDDSAALYTYSCALIKTGDLAGAADILMKLYRDGQYSAQAAYNLGLIYYKMKNYQESIRYYSEAVNRNPENIMFLYAYGFALSEFGNLEEASMQMNKVLSIDPGNADAKEWKKKYSNKKALPQEK